MTAMVATTSQRMMVSPTSRSMVTPPADPLTLRALLPERQSDVERGHVLQTQN